VVIDYKSSASMSLKEMAAGNLLQVPLYALAMERVHHLSCQGVEFIGLRENKIKGLYRSGAKTLCAATGTTREKTDAEWQAFLTTCENKIVEDIHALCAGAIPVKPTTKRCPERCAYYDLCRGDRFALARMARSEGAGEGEDG
jgi:ATP-dependent helicase/DNAse subunit B